MSQNKYNFKFNPPQLSSEQINKHKSFDDLMAQFETTPAPKEPAKVLKLRSVRRNVAYIAGIGAAAMIAISAYFTIGVNDIEKQMSERLLAQPYIFPQLEKLEKNYNTFIIEGTQGGTLEYESGSKVIVPANAFVDKNGEPLSGAIEIKFKEYHDFVDFFIAGIPMKYDSAGTNQLVSAGMIDIQAFQNGIPVALDKSKPLDIELASTIDYNPAHTYNIYKLDTTARNWVYEGVDRIEPVLDGDLKAEMDKILTDNEVEGDLTDVNNQIAAIRAEQAKELAKIEQSIPLPKQPVKPEPANSENFVTNFEFTDVAKTDEKISELADKYSSLLWEVSKDQATAFEIASNPDADWKDIKWTKTGNGLSYKITLINGVAGGKNLDLIVNPVLTGQDYQNALKEFDVQIAAFGEAQKEREAALKARKTELAHQMEERLAELEAQKRSHEERLAQYRQQGYKRLLTEEIMDQKIINKFKITSLGIWNCDRPIPPGLVSVQAKFQDENGQPVEYQNGYLVNKKRNTVAHFLTTGNQLGKMNFFNDSDNMMWFVGKDGRLSVVKPEDFKSIEGKNHTFRFTKVNEPIETEEDIRRVLEF
ncbi:MAG: bZIP transcription factor [Saprospiraceae bacterium]